MPRGQEGNQAGEGMFVPSELSGDDMPNLTPPPTALEREIARNEASIRASFPDPEAQKYYIGHMREVLTSEFEGRAELIREAQDAQAARRAAASTE